MSISINYQKISETFLPNNNRKHVGAIADSILSVLKGSIPTNHQEDELKELSKMKLREMSHNQRKQSANEIAKIKKKNRLEKLKDKCQKLKQDGKSWSEIYKALNLDRYREIINEIRKVFDG